MDNAAPRTLLGLPAPADDAARRAISAAYLADEPATVRRLAASAGLDEAARARINETATQLVVAVRAQHSSGIGIENLLQEYRLDTQEGVALMCLAEALLRIPDSGTADRLIRDKLGAGDWERHLGQSASPLVNAATWGLALTGRLLRAEDLAPAGLAAALRRIVARSGEPVMREAVEAALRVLGRQFVMGRTIGEALERAEAAKARQWRRSYDMLGEAARTEDDAARYVESYHHAIEAIGRAAAGQGPIGGPGVSIKLSALHPRYEFAQRERVMKELVPRLLGLAQAARAHDIGLTVDAEEAERLDLSLDVIAAVFGDPSLGRWDGFGLAVQAYQKRCLALIDWLAELARARGRKLSVRLVKGAYWDAEIKRAQERGLAGFPVFTRKPWTDLSYLAAARRLLAETAIYPQFATHNAHTLAAIHSMAAPSRAFEFQRLHGMGEALHCVARETLTPARPCRIYCPVGSHEDLLPYLVRRLLENGANTSFVHKVSDARTPLARVVEDPYRAFAVHGGAPHAKIAAPAALFAPERRNSAGLDLSDPATLATLAAELQPHRGAVTAVADTSEQDANAAFARAVAAQPAWDRAGAETRAALLERAADLFEANRRRLIVRIVDEGKRTIPDALSELREAVDFLRYYAAEARRIFAGRTLPGPTGERNTLALHGRGVFVAISPWNFPLSIFTGQVAAALAAGNSVLAKPAEQTRAIGAEAVRLLHEAGIGREVLQIVQGDGKLGGYLTRDARAAGVVFTGSTETARAINRALAARETPIAPLIAETGGQNAMIVDSSALPEQVVADTVVSAFNSAGQRCSALRVLFVQEDVADRIEKMLAGAMAELRLGDPWSLATDIGPVIDAEARESLERHIARLRRDARRIHDAPPAADLPPGDFVPPVAYGIDRIDFLTGEVFGPVLHVVRFAPDRLDAAIDAVNATDFGLTLGVHSRIDATIERICSRARVGNIYVNRNMIGAVVGVQPFGGQGLSGTGPKAGGPHYLPRFALERAIAINTTAAGGNATLAALDDDS